MTQEIRVKRDILERYITALFEGVDFSPEDAAFHARALVDTNMWGVDSHGVLRVPAYIQRIQSGAVNSRPNIESVRGSLGLEVMHGDDGAGFIVGRDAMARAIELAEEYNIAAVGAIHSNHFGATAIYTRMAAERGMVGIAMTNVVQNIVAPGGGKPVIGNNPLSIAIPTFGDFPFVLDISLSAVSGGKLLLASEKGEKIPMDWATDKHGRPTDDPDVGFEGFLLPVGGYKGLGLAYAVDMLTGVITGGAFLDGMKGMYKYPNDPSLTGHFMIAINIEAIIGHDEMEARMEHYLEALKASPMWDEDKEMLLPGEIEYRTEQKRQESGIPLPPSLYDDLLALGQELNVDETLETIN